MAFKNSLKILFGKKGFFSSFVGLAPHFSAQFASRPGLARPPSCAPRIVPRPRSGNGHRVATVRRRHPPGGAPAGPTALASPKRPPAPRFSPLAPFRSLPPIRSRQQLPRRSSTPPRLSPPRSTPATAPFTTFSRHKHRHLARHAVDPLASRIDRR